MFVPLYDDNPLRRIKAPWVNWALIVVNCLVFALEGTGMADAVLASFAIIPNELWKVGVLGGPAYGPNDGLAVPEGYTLVTYMFLHGDVLHLLGNMAFLWVFGDNVEDALGHLRYGLFYLLCGVAGGLTHAALQQSSGAPLIGASAGVAGVIAAYLLLYPKVLVWVLVLRFIPVRISAAFALGAWILTQLAMVATPYLVPGAQIGPVAWWAHIGGILAGALLVLLLRRPGTTLFWSRT
jgi:membrane associated rhomboid family serine protease